MKLLLSFLVACATTFVIFLTANIVVNFSENQFVFGDYKLVQISIFIFVGSALAIPFVFWPVIAFVAYLRKSWAPRWLYATVAGSLFLVPVLIIGTIIREKTDPLGWAQLQYLFRTLDVATVLWLAAFACGGAMFGGLYSHLHLRHHAGAA